MLKMILHSNETAMELIPLNKLKKKKSQKNRPFQKKTSDSQPRKSSRYYTAFQITTRTIIPG